MNANALRTLAVCYLLIAGHRQVLVWSFPGIRLPQQPQPSAAAITTAANQSSRQLVSAPPRLQARSDYLESVVVDPLAPNETTYAQSSSFSAAAKAFRRAEYDQHQLQVVQQQQERSKTIFAVALAVISGALDVICFQRFGCFAHLMTGNTVKCLTAASEMRWAEVLFYAAMITYV